MQLETRINGRVRISLGRHRGPRKERKKRSKGQKLGEDWKQKTFQLENRKDFS